MPSVALEKLQLCTAVGPTTTGVGHVVVFQVLALLAASNVQTWVGMLLDVMVVQLVAIFPLAGLGGSSLHAEVGVGPVV